MRHVAIAIALVGLAVLPAAATEPVSVMIVGTFHMANPGKDLHNMRADDMLAPRRQKEIAAVAEGLARFRPTLVAVEWPAAIADERYAAYLKKTLAPSDNEVVQLGFRLASLSGLKTVAGIDVDGEFPYDAVELYAKAHGKENILAAGNAEIEKYVRAQTDTLAHGTVGAVLRYVNDPALIRNGNAFYRLMLAVGGGNDQPGAELLTQWYKRNFLICANLVQRARPGDRAVVFFGSGHSFLLRQCVGEMPGYRLVEANGYLPR
ncbi:MAG TPA: DUF5694 domain-containing protein [Rhizomicrobium sp.]|jgi:hypothetical protein|nr:DUF5694 domain-containing protein [Rhizomicrobium sp.]